MKKFAAAVLVSATAMLGSIPAASAAETASTDDYLCVVYGKANPGDVTEKQAYIVVDKEYAVALIKEGEGVCPVFSSFWKLAGNSLTYNYEYSGRCDDTPIDNSYGTFSTNSEACSKVAETVGVIDSEDIDGSCITSSSLVHNCGRHEIQVLHSDVPDVPDVPDTY